MKWKDTDASDEAPDEVEEDYYDEEEYSPWRKGSGKGLNQTVSALMESPLLWIGAGAIVMILLVVAFMPKKEPGGVSARDVQQLRMRIERLEDQYSQLAPLMERIAATEGQQGQTKELSARLEQFEKQVQRSFAQIDSQLVRLQPSTKPAKPASPPTAARAPEKPKPAAAAPLMSHTVTSGDTLYGISKRYDVPVEDLRKLNGLGPQDPIKPGQKLTIRK